MTGSKYKLDQEPSKSHQNHYTLETYKVQNGQKVVPAKEEDTGSKGKWSLFSSMKSFVFFYSICAMLTISNTSMLSSQISTLEKHFSLSSTLSGSLLSCNEIGQLCVVLFISHFGHNGHIPRIIAVLAIVYSISMIITTIPNFIFPYSLPTEPLSLNTSKNDQFCSATNITSNPTTEKLDTSKSVWWALYIIGSTMVIQGICKGPRRPLTATYTDNNIHDRRKTGLFLGITITASMLSPSLAVLLGSAVSSIPVDLSDTKINKQDPRWVGAWWLGFLILGILGVITSVPIFFFPKKMEGAEGLPASKKNEIAKEEEKLGVVQKIKEFPVSVFRVFRRPIYTFILAAFCFISFSVTGVVYFGPKYIQNQYYMSVWKSNLVFGISHLIVVVMGTFSGGWITSKIKLSLSSTAKYIVFVNALTCILNFSLMFVGCENQSIVGLDKPIPVTEDSPPCYCNNKEFLPVCSQQNQVYLNPCIAQCWNKTDTGYGGCMLTNGDSVTTGMCEANCDTNFYLYMVLSLLMSFTGTQTIMPTYLMLLRSVEERDKTLATGISVCATSILGWLPAPVIYGNLIDGTCRLWENVNGGNRGSCQIYFLDKLRFRYLALEGGLKVCCFLMFVVVLFLCIRKERREAEEQTSKDRNEQEMQEKMTARF